MSLMQDASAANTIVPSVPGQSEQQQEVKTTGRLCEKCGLPRKDHPGPSKRIVTRNRLGQLAGVCSFENPTKGGGKRRGGRPTGSGGGGDASTKTGGDPPSDPGAAARAGAIGKGLKPGSPAGNKGLGKGTTAKGAPPWMAKMALKMPATPDFPDGQPVCFWRHNPAGSSCRGGATCRMSHACPVFVNGKICGQMHSAADHNPPYGGTYKP